MNKYLRYVFEIVAIVVGITISFIVDEWREDRQSRKETEKVLIDIHRNLENEILMLDEELIGFETGMSKLQRVYARNLMFNDLDSVTQYLENATTFQLPNWQINAGYLKFVSSLQNPIIEDSTLFGLLSNHYDDESYDYVNERINNSSKRLYQYLTDNIPFMGWSIEPIDGGSAELQISATSKLLFDYYFKNNVWTKYAAWQTAFIILGNRRVEAAELMQVIENELK